jgi:hypothetical protein
MLVALAVALVVGLVSIAAAQPPNASKPTRNVSGTVRTATTDTIVVSGRDKGKDAEWTFAVEPTTSIRKGTKSITAGDLKPGDAIHVRYVERDGKATAQSIIVRGPRKPAPK